MIDLVLLPLCVGYQWNIGRRNGSGQDGASNFVNGPLGRDTQYLGTIPRDRPSIDSTQLAAGNSQIRPINACAALLG